MQKGQSTMLGEVQVLNTLATDLIGQGENQEAVEALSDAVAQLSWSQLMPTPIGGSVKTAPRPEHGISIYLADSAPHDPLPAPREEEQEDFSFHPYIFECTTSMCQDEPSLTNEQYCFSTITCLYNIGLCYQVEWHRRQRTSPHLLVMAQRFYEQAYSLTANCVIRPNDPVVQVLMSVCSNSTHCCNELASMGQGQVWNNRLRRVMEFSGQRRPFFLRSAFFNSFSRVSAPAA